MSQPFPIGFTPQEWRGRGAPEKALWFEVLFDGVACYFGQVGYEAEREQLRREAEEWIRTAGTDDPRTFDSVCERLGLDAGDLRGALLGTDPRHRLTAAFDRQAPPRKQVCVIDLELVKALACDGVPIPVIARRFGMNRKVIYKLLRPFGLVRARVDRGGIDSRRVRG